jgi:hypothetical protein
VSRGGQIAVLVVLAAVAAGQVTISLMRALQTPQVPPLYVDPRTRSALAPPVPSSVSGVPTDAVATPDPANIIRMRLDDAALRPARMRAKSGTRLMLLVDNEGKAGRVIVARDARGRESARSNPLQHGEGQQVFLELGPGTYKISVAASSLASELVIEP